MPITNKHTFRSRPSYETILTSLEPRLDKIGELTTKEARALADPDSIHVFNLVFKDIMNTMIEQGKANLVKNGRYRILKPNRKYHDKTRT